MQITRKNLVFVVVFAAIVLSTAPAHAISVKDYEAMAVADQSNYLVTFLEKMTYDLGQKNPELATQIKDFYVRKHPGKPVSDGIEAIELEMWSIDEAAKKGKADLTKIQVEGVVVYVTKQHFSKQMKSQ